MPVNESVNAVIRGVLRDHARLPVDVDSIADDADLFAAGIHHTQV
jgi:hypothetical protein